MSNRNLIKPQRGFQENFLASPADIVIGGGSAGAGKSFALLMEPIRHAHVRGFYGVIFRRTTVQVKNSGGLWDTSKELYLKLRDSAGRVAEATEAPPKWKFPSGATLLFSHLEHEHTKLGWDGSQMAFIGFDELIHFTESQFWYLVGRNRTTCGVKPYVRATTNPQTSGWVKRLIAWWIYPDDYEIDSLRGMPIRERAGVLRYFARIDERIYWSDSREGVLDFVPEAYRAQYRLEMVKSFTFIPGSLADNVELMEKDPGYEGNLMAQDRKHAIRLLKGCWYDVGGENDLFSLDVLEDAFSNSFVAEGERYISADVAMDGSDVFRIGVWSGLRLLKVYSYERSDGKFVWERLLAISKLWAVPGRNIVFDANGVGNFLSGFFRSSYDFRSQSAPIEQRPSDGKGEAVKVNYENLRTQCAYKASQVFSENGIYIEVDDREKDMIAAELAAHQKTGMNSAGRLTITRKDDVKIAVRRSPDYADLIFMRMVFELGAKRKTGLAS